LSINIHKTQMPVASRRQEGIGARKNYEIKKAKKQKKMKAGGGVIVKTMEKMGEGGQHKPL